MTKKNRLQVHLEVSVSDDIIRVTEKMEMSRSSVAENWIRAVLDRPEAFAEWVGRRILGFEKVRALGEERCYFQVMVDDDVMEKLRRIGLALRRKPGEAAAHVLAYAVENRAVLAEGLEKRITRALGVAVA